MPKPMQLLVDIEEIAFGRVFLTIVGEGVKRNAAAVAPHHTQKRGGTSSVPCLILGALMQSPGLSRPQLEAVLEGNGKKGTSLPDALYKLRAAKEIVSKGKGKGVTYAVTGAGKKHYETACTIQSAEQE
jgi:hypothetical protein